MHQHPLVRVYYCDMIVIEQKEKLFAQKPYEFLDDIPESQVAKGLKSNLRTIEPKLIKTFKHREHDPNKVKFNSASFEAKCDNKRKEYYRKIERLINKCKESEVEMQGIKVNKAKQQQCNKELSNISWAIKEYLIRITGKTWMRTANIKNLLAIREANKKLKKLLFTPELIDSIRTNMTRRAVIMTSLGQKSIWKPPRYVLSRQVVLANSMEELNNLYQIEGIEKYK